MRTRILKVHMIKQVGTKYPGHKACLTYQDIEKDNDGWVDPSKWLPLPYDMVQVDIGNKILNCWHSGMIWEGLHLRKKHVINKWKRKPEDYE